MTCLPVIWINAYVYQTEIFNPKWRYFFVGLFEMPFHYYISALIAYLNRTWTGIHIGVGIAVAVSLPIYFLVPESPRWLAQNNKTDQALKILVKMAKINGENITSEQQTEVKTILSEIATESHKTEDKLAPWDMFRKGHLIKTLILCFAWITSCVSFYALSLKSSDLDGHIILNFTLGVTANFGTCIVIILTANYFGRTKTLVASHTVLGLSCLGLAFIPKTEKAAILVVYMMAKIVASVSFSLVYLITIELYPTNLRSQAVGSSSAIARVFCACAPFLGPLAKIWQPLPMLVLGVPILISGALVLRLPETLEAQLPQTMQNAVELEERNTHNRGPAEHSNDAT
jgi:OCT family organic cation transporter-like MFS transporter 4/5